jgi:hypothetical protein
MRQKTAKKTTRLPNPCLKADIHRRRQSDGEAAAASSFMIIAQKSPSRSRFGG